MCLLSIYVLQVTLTKSTLQNIGEVHKGDTLLVLDDREYKIRVMEAEAALKDAQAGATVINATLNTTQTTASVYDASIAEIEVRLAKLEKTGNDMRTS